ncbi:MAG: Rieske (2Fe-2S) protein [Bacteroidetes bacterium]|nr:Rieske (2Fe-2S) protein [Bacteroidota bacterium]
MNRFEFLKVAGVGAVACACGSLVSCGNKALDPAPSNIDFTLDLSQSANAALTVDGGSLTNQGILIVRISVGNFTAVYRSCTHEGTAVNYQSNKFVCPNHGATFDINGNVTKGPATSSLRKYNTQLTNNSLRVYS